MNDSATATMGVISSNNSQNDENNSKNENVIKNVDSSLKTTGVYIYFL